MMKQEEKREKGKERRIRGWIASRMG